MTQNELEIRLLGPLRVRRGDGTEVDPREWRTGKTADLLRLLAVRSGQPVPVDTILEALWPRVDRQKGLASLRTAACQIRRVLRQNCIERQHDGLMLAGAWVDTVAFAQLAVECRGLAAERRWGRVTAVAREAETMYVDDLGAYDTSIAILDEQRVAMRELRLQVLLDAADAAVYLQSFWDGIEFSRRVIDADPFSERAYRALMRSHAGVGETHRALAAFEQCRLTLADELGVEPDLQTRALHLQMLSARPALQVPSGSHGVADATHRVKLLELIGDVAVAMGSHHEAEEAYAAAISVGRRHGVPIVESFAARDFTTRRPANLSAATVRIRDLVRELKRDLHVVPAPADVVLPGAS